MTVHDLLVTFYRFSNLPGAERDTFLSQHTEIPDTVLVDTVLLQAKGRKADVQKRIASAAHYIAKKLNDTQCQSAALQFIKEASMPGKFKEMWFRASLDKYKYEKQKLFGKEEIEKYNDRVVDFQDFADRLCSVYEKMASEGYDEVNVVPIAMGESEPNVRQNGDYMGDVGFSITRGAIVVGKKPGS